MTNSSGARGMLVAAAMIMIISGFLSPSLGAAAEGTGELVISRSLSGASGGVVVVELDGAFWSELAGKAPLARTLSPGRYQVTFRLLNSSGGAGVFGVEPLEHEVQVQGGRQTSLTLLLVPEVLGTVLKVTEKG